MKIIKRLSPVVKAFISTSGYRGDLLNIEYAYFKQMVSRTTIN